MKYIYTCKDHPDQRVEVVHAMASPVIVFCPVPNCQKHMHRVPQAIRFYINPRDVLFDKLDQKYRDYRARTK